ncbi:MAG: peptidase T [Lachnospiraceae bacterium]|nr:peptidase T [Lachnospiraceae bacterium]
MRAYERFLKYVSYTTPSNEDSHSSPSSQCQFELGRALVQELKEIGIEDAQLDEYCYVYGHLPATKGLEDKPCLGWIAHMDTVADFCDHDAAPVVTENYDGKDFVLGSSGRVLSVDVFPHLPDLKGQTLITTDGTTVLGADDKAGIAAIMTLLERLQTEQIPHGPIAVAFTPDEEICRGTDHFDLEKFNAQFGYTIDGGKEGEIEYENFNAGSAVVTVDGVNVHPGSSKNVMINASLVAMEFNAMLPTGDTPRDTKEYEGFYHLTSMEGNVAHAQLNYIVRDHDAAAYEMRKKTLEHITELLNDKWGDHRVTLTYTEQYRNMEEIIREHPHLVENAKKACELAGVEPIVMPIRGGTDGAMLSFKGLPCPNLGTGGYGFHGPYEHITAEAMDRVTNIAMEIVKLYSAQ